MNEPSEEQRRVIDLVKQGKNVAVDASAGSGKSTTILSCAYESKKNGENKKYLQLTYNKQLRKEVQEKIEELELKNIQVHTYHSLAVKYYFSGAHDDSGIRKILREKMSPRNKIPKIDVLVLDEIQDMTPLYYQLMYKYMTDMGAPFQVLALGDKRQGLYEFKGADIRFLTLADCCWENHPMIKTREFVKCTLQTSYRVTIPMAEFVNKAMLDETRLIACKPGISVIYFRRERRMLDQIVIGQIRKILNTDPNVSYGDFFILGGSVKSSRNLIRRIENALVQDGIPCYVPMIENQDQLDQRVIDGKVVFSTFHSVKGRQRKYVFVVGFDQTYFDYYGKDYPINECPNTLYVACTRATDVLYLLETKEYPKTESSVRKGGPLSFLKMNHMEMKQSDFVTFHGDPCSVYSKEETDSAQNEPVLKKKFETPTSLTRFISDSVLDIITPKIERMFVPLESSKIVEESPLSEPELLDDDEIQDQEEEYYSGEDDISEVSGPLEKNPAMIDIPSVINTKNGYYEEVSDLNGIVLPIMFYDYLNGEPLHTLQDIIKHESREFKPTEHAFLKKEIDTMPTQCESTSDYLYLANLLLAVQERLYSKIKQIGREEYKWLSNEIISECYSRLDKAFGDECRKDEWFPEKTIIRASADEDHTEIDYCLRQHLGNEYTYRFEARVDLVTADSVWELKCVSQITIEHMLQVIIYAWLWRMVYKLEEKERQFKLFNIKTGELFLLEASTDELTEIIVELLKGKYKTNYKMTDSEFVSSLIDHSF